MTISAEQNKEDFMWHVVPSMKSHVCALNGEYRKILNRAKSIWIKESNSTNHLAIIPYFIMTSTVLNLIWKSMNTELEKEFLDSARKNPGNWKGVFYNNRNDYRIIVPKQNALMGWTLNFSSPFAYIALIAIILIIIVFSFLI